VMPRSASTETRPAGTPRDEKDGKDVAPGRAGVRTGVVRGVVGEVDTERYSIRESRWGVPPGADRQWSRRSMRRIEE
jgi:hypothetical protein